MKVGALSPMSGAALPGSESPSEASGQARKRAGPMQLAHFSTFSDDELLRA
jgi:hypothetical protein